jgi:hypothetical protein
MFTNMKSSKSINYLNGVLILLNMTLLISKKTHTYQASQLPLQKLEPWDWLYSQRRHKLGLKGGQHKLGFSQVNQI